MRWRRKQQERRLEQLRRKKQAQALLYSMTAHWPQEWDVPEPEEKPFLFSSEPIIGYRCFRWGSCDDIGELFDLCAKAPAGENAFEWARRPRLMSVAYGSTWPEHQPMQARCNQSHATPHTGAAARTCTCGLWAVKTKEWAKQNANQYGTIILAEVALWGHFVEHSHGWRAEYGYPQRIIVSVPHHQRRGWKREDFEKYAAMIGDQYGIPHELWIEEPPPKPKPRDTNPYDTNLYRNTAGVVAVSASSSGLSGYIISNVTPPTPPAPVWPASIVHPSELYSTIVLPKQVAIYMPDLPF